MFVVDNGCIVRVNFITKSAFRFIFQNVFLTNFLDLGQIGDTNNGEWAMFAFGNYIKLFVFPSFFVRISWLLTSLMHI